MGYSPSTPTFQARYICSPEADPTLPCPLAREGFGDRWARGPWTQSGMKMIVADKDPVFLLMGRKWPPGRAQLEPGRGSRCVTALDQDAGLSETCLNVPCYFLPSHATFRLWGVPPVPNLCQSDEATQSPDQSQAPTCHRPADPLVCDGDMHRDTNLGWHEELQAEALPSHGPSQKQATLLPLRSAPRARGCIVCHHEAQCALTLDVH